MQSREPIIITNQSRTIILFYFINVYSLHEIGLGFELS